MAAGVGASGLLNMLPFQKAKGSFVTLEQSILPGFVPPKPLDRVLKGDSTLQMRCIVSCFNNCLDGMGLVQRLLNFHCHAVYDMVIQVLGRYRLCCTGLLQATIETFLQYANTAK